MQDLIIATLSLFHLPAIKLNRLQLILIATAATYIPELFHMSPASKFPQ
jgi:hypothetical protein